MRHEFRDHHTGDPHLGAWNWDEFCAVSSHEVSSLTLEEKRVKGNATHKPFLYFGRQVIRTALNGVSSGTILDDFVRSRADNPMDYNSVTLSGYQGDYTLDFSIDHCAGTAEVEDPPPPDTRNPPDPPPPDGGEGGTPTPPWFE